MKYKTMTKKKKREIEPSLNKEVRQQNATYSTEVTPPLPHCAEPSSEKQVQAVSTPKLDSPN